ncbi:maturation protein [ssRNA phage SRR5466728_3]|uniref:Maturation protein n=1 Tax=ssRNA phage SRR5466728_3 TaxID=2786441 RepID=A0A8S5L559_9VIRU|nr:maturation protein [ssRNA phage SRR5466728_3]DAD52463.1 TPA_asm: maturation protein [ssRNA phage SRR5466728_3]
MAMQNHDVYDYGTQRYFGHGYSGLNRAVKARRIFVCSTSKGDYVHTTPHNYTKHIYSGRNGIDVLDTCYLGKYKLEGISGDLGVEYLTHLLNVPSYEAEISDRAMEKIYDLIKGNNNFIVDLAEAAPTLNMLRNTVNLKRFAKNFFDEVLNPKSRVGKKLPTSGQRRLDYITEKWLEGRYGWLPSVYSIYDAMDTLGGKHVINGAYPVKGRASTKKEVQQSFGLGTYGSPQVTTTSKLSTRIEHCYLFKLDPSARIYDWTSLNPVGIAWELLPLSFVADWLVNVSQQLSLWENYFLFNSRVVDGYTTRTWLQETVQFTLGITKGSYMTWPNGQYIDGPYGDKTTMNICSLRTTSLNRVRGTSLPLPGGIRLSVNFNSKRQMDLAALFHQMVGKRFR